VARHTTLSDARRTAAAVVLQPARGTRRSSTCWTCPLQRPPPPGRRRGMSRRPPAPRCRRRQTRKLSYQVGSLQVAGGSGGKTKQDHERSGGRETSTCSRPRTRPEGEVLQLLNAVSLPRRISERVNCRQNIADKWEEVIAAGTLHPNVIVVTRKHWIATHDAHSEGDSPKCAHFHHFCNSFVSHVLGLQRISPETRGVDASRSGLFNAPSRLL